MSIGGRNGSAIFLSGLRFSTVISECRAFSWLALLVERVEILQSGVRWTVNLLFRRNQWQAKSSVLLLRSASPSILLNRIPGTPAHLSFAFFSLLSLLLVILTVVALRKEQRLPSFYSKYEKTVQLYKFLETTLKKKKRFWHLWFHKEPSKSMESFHCTKILYSGRRSFAHTKKKMVQDLFIDSRTIRPHLPKCCHSSFEVK